MSTAGERAAVHDALAEKLPQISQYARWVPDDDIWIMGDTAIEALDAYRAKHPPKS